MKKTTKIFRATALLLLTAMLSIGVIGCKQNDKVKELTITLHANGGKFADGSETKLVKILKGEKLAEFEKPLKEGLYFLKWCLDKHGNSDYDFSNSVTESFTLYAMWTDNASESEADNEGSLTVIFDANGGEFFDGSTYTVKVGKNKLLKDPESEATLINHKIEAWYKEKECKNKWDFSKDKVTKNITLYAKWIYKPAEKTMINIKVSSMGLDGYGTSFTVKKGSTWASIKEMPEIKEKKPYDNDEEIYAWTYGDETGFYLFDTYEFKQDCELRAATKKTGAPDLKKFTITLIGDANVTKLPSSFFVKPPRRIPYDEKNKAYTWDYIQGAIKSQLEFKSGYAFKEWRFENASGSIVPSTYGFTENTTIYVVSKEKSSSSENLTIFETDGNGCITGYKCCKEDLPTTLIIPDKIGDELITRIGKKAFLDCERIEKLDFSQCTALRAIASEAFCSCWNIKGTVKLPASLEIIEDGAKDSAGFYDGVFSNCNDVEEFDFSDCINLKYIGIGAFCYCIYAEPDWGEPYGVGIQKVDLSKCTALTEIAEGAFFFCTDIKKLQLPDSLKIIGKYAFSDCKSIANDVLKLPASLEKIGEDAFTQSWSHGGPVKIRNFDFSACTELKEIGKDAFAGCKEFSSLDFSNCTKLTHINESAFSSCNIKNLKFPPNVEFIKTSFGDKVAGTLVFPASLKELDYGFACYDTENSTLTKVDFSACTQLSHIGANTFHSCIGLTNIDLSNCTSLELIGFSAFSNCRGIKNISFPKNLVEIEDYAFSGCSNLVNIDLSDCTSLKKLGGATGYALSSSSFADCTSVTSIDLSGCTSLKGDELFSFNVCSNLKSITLPATICEISDYLFYHWSALTNITVPTANPNYLSEDGVLFNKDKTKLICYPAGKSEKSYTVPSTVTSFTGDAFRGSSALENIDLSECTNITSIDDGVFSQPSLKSIILPASLKSFDGSAFNGCRSLENIIVVSANPNYSSEGGVLFNKDKTKLIFYPGGKSEKSYTVPSTVTSFTGNAFRGSSALENIDLSECTNITSINSGFSGYNGLKSIILPASLTTIETYAFEDCTGLTSIDLSKCTNLTSIDGFSGCTGLTSIDLSKCTNLTSIDGFSGCTGLTSIDLSKCTNLTSIGYAAFKDCIGLTSINFPSNLESVGGFSGCTGLTSIDFPFQLKSIRGFSGCTGLTSINFPSILESVGGFSGCTGLTSLNFPSTLKDIIDGFSGCTGLTSISLPASLDYIRLDSFKACTGLASIDLSKCTNLTSIDGFDGCTGLASIDLSKCTNLTSIDGFAECIGLTSIDLSSCTKLKKIWAFYECTGLTSVDLSSCEKLETISAFSGCTGLTSINFPPYLKQVRGFSGCTGLTSVDLSSCKWLKEIYAFDGCTGLTSVDLSSLTSLRFIGGFSNCSNAIIKLPNVNYYTQIGNNAFCGDSYCKEVHCHPSLKQQVIDCGYPEDRITTY